MENTKTKLNTSNLSLLTTWRTNIYRKIVFNILSSVDDTRIEIFEDNQTTVLGNIHVDNTIRINIIHSKAYKDIVTGGSIGAGEAYIDRLWTTPNLTAVIQMMVRHQQKLDQLDDNSSLLNKFKSWLFHRNNRNSVTGAKNNILAHYDIGNELYTRFLDDSMMYSSAIYSDTHTTLAQAQQNKLALICQRLDIKPTDSVVEIGTGWGGLAIYIAQHFGCQVTTTTISDEQYQFAKEKIAKLGLTSNITLLKKDYRKLEGTFDKLVSIEMIESVGHEYFSEFFTTCNNLLKPNGKMLIQSITIADQRYKKYINSVDFIQRYIFPGGCLPCVATIAEHIREDTSMMIEQLHDIGQDYAKTLADWRVNFDKNWEQLPAFGFDNKFRRLWHFYLSYCEGAFIERATSTVHVVAHKN